MGPGRQLDAQDGAAAAILMRAAEHERRGNLGLAARLYHRAIETEPANADAAHRLALVLARDGKAKRAEAAFRKALLAAPERKALWRDFSAFLAGLGRLTEAADAFSHLIPAQASQGFQAKFQLARALNHVGQHETAVEVYREWLRREPDNAIAEHFLAALTGNGVPPRATDAFVATIFDQFAAEFEAELGKLDYVGPSLIGNALRAALGAPERRLDILDAGCGTGLCGPPLRPYARHLAGIDLSAAMLERAAARKLYDTLATAEITAFLAKRHAAFDVIICADTLIYFGALDAVFRAAAGALHKGGLLVFTVEKSAADFELRHHGRYAHGRAYLERTAAASALEILALDEQRIRNELGGAVIGYIVTARAR